MISFEQLLIPYYTEVVFKWAKEANDKLRRKKGIKARCNAQLQTLPSIGLNMPKDEDDLKVLMIDQLWCWIVDDGKFSCHIIRQPWTIREFVLTIYQGNVVTFFPAKEEKISQDVAEEGGIQKTSGQSSRTEDRNSATNNVHQSHRPPSKAVLSPADLRDEIYDEMNGGETLIPPNLSLLTI